MSPVQAPADKRFRRAHVKPGRRRRWHAWTSPLLRYGLASGVVCAGLLWAGAGLMRAGQFDIARIEVRGNAHLPAEAVTAALSGLRGQNIMWSDLSAWRGRLLASPWVKDAVIRRVLPKTIEVTVRERTPIGLGRIGEELYLVDEQGAVVDTFGPQYESLDLPIIDGLTGAAEENGGTAVDRARAELAARLLSALKASPEIAERVSQVDVSDRNNAAVILNDDPSLLYVGTDRFVPRLQSYLQLADTMKERVPGIDVVDLRFDDRNWIFVRPALSHGKTR